MSASPGSTQTERLTEALATALEELLREVPVGATLTVSSDTDIGYSLERFIPGLLRRSYLEWRDESLDGIFVAYARKTGPSGLEMAGTCILIRDQTVTPFMAEFQVVRPSQGTSVEALKLMVGEAGAGALGISGPPCNSREARLVLATLMQRIEDVAWVYTLRPARDVKRCGETEP